MLSVLTLLPLILAFYPQCILSRPHSIPLSFTGAELAYDLPEPHPEHAHQARLRLSSLPQEAADPTFTVNAVPTTVYRPRSVDAMLHARSRSLRHAQSEIVEWDPVDMLGPDVEDRHTLAQLARMTGNAYALPGQKNWYEVDPVWNVSFPFGWEDVTEGFRGHVFLSADNSTVILSIKGTTLQGPTSKKDKYNDNLLFSCCCARVDFSWVFSTVCDCFSGHWTCDNTCLSDALIEDSLFYSVGVELVKNLTSLYPTSDVWLVGHSLGGALASLLGTTFGLPAVAFESPGERLAAQRLHLPMPPRSNDTTFPLAPVTHVYHNADPIPQGACTGFGSPCASAGYALETRCHLGRTILYDTVGKLGWRVDVRKHPIKEVILNVLELEQEWEEGRDVPTAVAEADCIDCFKWEFGDYKD
ncbi:alpha/beta-hydrolase [Artomyces pyxidatus]|uniref:Alpha/beta-hydrolase n=1 Tax=Artomyces pyxidatus TaxID=48021 RepID=A0ACB8T2G7_9AGAM|nr:alpha/beta-hydrolase [Artomyces pyxidatus]